MAGTKAKAIWLDLAALAAITGALALTVRFALRPGWLDAGLACVFGYTALRIAYEMTINRRHVPTIASAPAVRQQVAALIAQDAAAKRGGHYKVVDLGSGRGELARAIARKLRHVMVTGVERAVWPYRRAKWMQRLFGPPNLSFRQDDLFAYDCRDADAVVLFLGKLTVPAGNKLRRELAPGSLVISNDFELGEGWAAPERLILRTPFRTILYAYRR